VPIAQLIRRTSNEAMALLHFVLSAHIPVLVPGILEPEWSFAWRANSLFSTGSRGLKASATGAPDLATIFPGLPCWKNACGVFAVPHIQRDTFSKNPAGFGIRPGGRPGGGSFRDAQPPWIKAELHLIICASLFTH